MLQKIITAILKRRHFWRYATFSEVAELYAAKLLRTMALYIAAMFITVYLYQLGYSLVFIAAYQLIYMVVKGLLSLPGGWFVSHFGPKHAMLVGNLLYAPAMFLVTLVPQYGWVVLIPTLLLQTCSAVVYDIGQSVDFSRVKSVTHTGKELGFMNIFEKFATGISPLIGGTIAFLAGPHVVMVVAAVLFGLAALPLFRTGEPVPVHQPLRLRGFPWRTAWRSLRAQIGVGYDDLSSSGPWSLFLIIVILASTSNEIYAQLGSFTSVTLLTAFVASYIYGKLIDHRKGRYLLRFSTIANSLVHLTRPLITTPIGVVTTNVANEAATTGYKMAFTKGAFDLADSSGNRVLYLTLMQMAHHVGSMSASAVLLICALLLGEPTGLKVFFVTAAVVVLLVMTARFPLYKK